MTYSLTEIEDTAKEVIHALADLDVPNPLAIAALCKAIVMIANEDDLDMACKLIDDFADRRDDE